MVNGVLKRSAEKKQDSYAREVARKLFHAAVMLGTVLASSLIFQTYGIEAMKTFLLYLLLLVLLTEWLVIDVGAYLPLYRELERPKERHRMHGSAYCLIGSLLAILFFPLKIAFVATMMVAITDVVTGLVGMKWGRIRVCGPKTLEGTASGLALNIVIGLAFLPAPVGLAMALTATVVEAAVNIVDDNLAVPVFAGFAGQIAMAYLLH
ncbi:MAG: hypothetical protein AABX47_09920 [Nanoarchaeota archaeon]